MNRYQYAEDIVWNHLDETEVVCLNMETGSYSGIKDVGMFIWQQLEQPRSLKQLVDMIVAAYDVDENTVNSDLEAFLRQLLDANLIRSVD